MKNFLIVILLSGIILLSCTPSVYKGKPLTSSLGKHQPDIPIPTNFFYLEERSRIEEFSSFRLCEMKYRSTPDSRHGISAVKNFYTRLMSRYEWTNITPKDMEKKLIFSKNGRDDEFCAIEFSTEKRVITLNILIGGKGLAGIK